MDGMRWTFDDYNLGLAKRDDRVVKVKVVARPDGLTTADWYTFASELCAFLNKRDGT